MLAVDNDYAVVTVKGKYVCGVYTDFNAAYNVYLKINLSMGLSLAFNILVHIEHELKGIEGESIYVV